MTPAAPDVDRARARPCPYRARAWWGERLVAETTSALRVEAADGPPLLCFPLADARLELFRDEGRPAACPAVGTARAWSIDGQDVLWTFPDSGTPEWMRGLAAFDHDRARVELVDAADGDAPREAAVTRFPTWGDAADLVDVLDVRPAGARRYVGVARADWRRPVVEGSQMLAQAIVAAGRHAPGRRPVAAHMVFPRAADAYRDLEIELDEVSAGRTFTTLAVRVGQAGRVCATGTVLLDVTSPDAVRHAAAPPDVAGPDDSEPFDMGVAGRDLRVVDGAYTGDPDAPVGPPTLDVWVRFRRVPDDPILHAGLLAQFTGHMSIAAALRPHPGVGQDQAHRTLSTAVNAIAVSIHRDVRADRWMLYRHLSTFAGDGMTHAECRVHDDAGDLLASFTVDAMVRPFAGGAPADDRRALP
ncbi:MAG TPA: acyl-CoA thioesterase domain-containing protein [Acidimicrobiales bacterium]|nr:acyl-CoA thioesterase domain-containing protein [Acidimicrobiales bacterium]